MKVKLKRIGLLSFAINQALWMGALGVLAGFISLIVFLLGATFFPEREGYLPSMIVGSFIAVATPIIYVAIGFVAGLFTTLVWNIAFRLTGGLDLEIENEDGGDHDASNSDVGTTTLFGGPYSR